VTRGWLSQRAGSPCLNGGGTTAAVPLPQTSLLGCYQTKLVPTTTTLNKCVARKPHGRITAHPVDTNLTDAVL